MIADKYLGLRAYHVDDKTKTEGIIVRDEHGNTKLEYDDGCEIVTLQEIILLDDICGYSSCANTDIFQDGLCEVCYYKFSEF